MACCISRVVLSLPILNSFATCRTASLVPRSVLILDPLLLVAIVAAIAVVDAFRGFNRPLMIWSLAILVGLLLAPFSGWALDWPRDQLRLVLWSAILDLPPFGKPPEDGVLIMWEDWGWGGMPVAEYRKKFAGPPG